MRTAPSTAAGFTLIELMIGVAIAGILATVALPSYRDQMRKSRRAEAQAYVMAVAARQTQYLIDTRGYTPSLADIGVALPANVGTAYDIALAAPDASPPTFVLTATPRPDQAAEACGTLRIDQSGSKSATRAGVPVAGCW